jgi:hypothetical protein
VLPVFVLSTLAALYGVVELAVNSAMRGLRNDGDTTGLLLTGVLDGVPAVTKHDEAKRQKKVSYNIKGSKKCYQ